MTDDDLEILVCVGTVGKAIGLKGWLNFWPKIDCLTLLPSLNTWIKESWKSNTPCKIAVQTVDTKRKQILFAGISDRSAAQRLTHASLWIEKEMLRKHDNEYLCSEILVGFEVRLFPENEMLGKVRLLLPTPGYQLLQIERQEEDQKNRGKSLQLLPFLPEISIRSIDFDAQIVWITKQAYTWLEY